MDNSNPKLASSCSKLKGVGFYHTIPTFSTLREKPFENTVGKEKKYWNQHFLLNQQGFLVFTDQIST